MWAILLKKSLVGRDAPITFHAGTARVSRVLPGFTLRVFPLLLSTEIQYLRGLFQFLVDFLRVFAGFCRFLITLVPSHTSSWASHTATGRW
jgi:hypothetical protein